MTQEQAKRIAWAINQIDNPTIEMMTDIILLNCKPKPDNDYRICAEKLLVLISETEQLQQQGDFKSHNKYADDIVMVLVRYFPAYVEMREGLKSIKSYLIKQVDSMNRNKNEYDAPGIIVRKLLDIIIPISKKLEK